MNIHGEFYRALYENGIVGLSLYVACWIAALRHHPVCSGRSVTRERPLAGQSNTAPVRDDVHIYCAFEAEQGADADLPLRLALCLRHRRSRYAQRRVRRSDISWGRSQHEQEHHYRNEGARRHQAHAAHRQHAARCALACVSFEATLARCGDCEPERLSVERGASRRAARSHRLPADLRRRVRARSRSQALRARRSGRHRSTATSAHRSGTPPVPRAISTR